MLELLSSINFASATAETISPGRLGMDSRSTDAVLQ